MKALALAAFFAITWLTALAADPPPTFPGVAAGVPAQIQSTFGPKKMNFELVSPVATGGLMHFWRHNNDSSGPEDMSWHGKAPVEVVVPPSYSNATAAVEKRHETIPMHAAAVAVLIVGEQTL